MKAVKHWYYILLFKKSQVNTVERNCIIMWLGQKTWKVKENKGNSRYPRKNLELKRG